MTFQHDNLDDIIANFEYPKPAKQNSNIYGLLGVLTSENERLDLDIESLYDNRFLDSATGAELGKIAFEVGVQRNTGESDPHLRARTKAAYGRLSSDATYDDVAAAIRNTLDAGETDVSLTTPPNTSDDKVVETQVDGAVFSESPLTKDELTDYLDDAVSAGADLQIILEGTFAFDGSDSSLEGFGTGTWSSTV